MAKNQSSPKTAKAATTQPSNQCNDASLPVRVGLESMDDEALEQLERAIGEVLAARYGSPKPYTDHHPAYSSVERVRCILLSNSYFSFNPPATLDDPWAKNVITSVKRQLHQLQPAELISLSMYLYNAVRSPLSSDFHAHVQARADIARRNRK